jgi:hypothetical protein
MAHAICTDRVAASGEGREGLFEERGVDFVPSGLFQMAAHLISGCQSVSSLQAL